MSLLENLCDDIKRFIFLFLDDDDLEKISSNVLKENDIFWRMRTFDDYVPTHKDMYMMSQRYMYNAAYHWRDYNFDVSTDFEFFLQISMMSNFLKCHPWREMGKHNVEYILENDEYIKRYMDCQDCHGNTLRNQIKDYIRGERALEIESIQKIIEFQIVNNEEILLYLINSYELTEQLPRSAGGKILSMIKYLIDHGDYSKEYQRSVINISKLKNLYSEEELKKHGIWEHL